MLHKVTSIDDLCCPFQLYILCVSAVFNMKTQLLEWKKICCDVFVVVVVLAVLWVWVFLFVWIFFLFFSKLLLSKTTTCCTVYQLLLYLPMYKTLWCVKQFLFPVEKFNFKLLNPIRIFYFGCISISKKSIQARFQAMKFGFLALF